MKVTNFLLKIISIVILLQFIVFPIKVEASIWGDLFSQSSDFLKKGQQASSDDVNTGELKEASGTLFNVALAIGTVLAVAIGGILGIKFMIASAEDKAKIKEMLIPYVLGCVVVFGAFGIWKFTVNIGNSFQDSVQLTSDERLQEVRQNNSNYYERIQSGEIDPNDLSEETLKTIYRANGIDSDLKAKTTVDRRSGGNTSAMTLTQALAELQRTNPTKYKIYMACKNKGLMSSDGINLN